ncbi:MAG: hypothetical protein D6767_05655 [Candidatus Hydrogenedentota bacterium]|nr:MAG: hypothetical protein D6767_05655 [Candidatus Hydrogenedentota bacterium]
MWQRMGIVLAVLCIQCAINQPYDDEDLVVLIEPTSSPCYGQYDWENDVDVARIEGSMSINGQVFQPQYPYLYHRNSSIESSIRYIHLFLDYLQRALTIRLPQPYNIKHTIGASDPDFRVEWDLGTDHYRADSNNGSGDFEFISGNKNQIVFNFILKHEGGTLSDYQIQNAVFTITSRLCYFVSY